MLRRTITTLRRARLLLVLLGIVMQTGLASAQETNRPQERKLKRGDKVTIRNSFGRAVIRGWDRDVVQAAAVREGAESELAAITMVESPAGALLISPAVEGKRGNNIVLTVSLPHYAKIESISTESGDIEVIGLEGPVDVKSEGGNVQISRLAGLAYVNTGSGNIKIDQVFSAHVKSQSGDVTLSNMSGAATVETRSGRLDARNIAGDLIVKVESGSVSLDNIAGHLDIALSSSSLKVYNAGSNIHAATIGGSINLQCVQGAVEASTVNGSITLAGIGADVSARTTSGGIRLTTAMRNEGRYTLKSLSGSVRMFVESEAPGFNATLSSYSGGITTEFPLLVGTIPARLVPGSRRLVGRYGQGRAQIELDSFEGSVSLNKVASGPIQTCPK